jgi:hypothetical protein
MALYILPPKRTGLQEFTEGVQPYIQQAFAMLLQKQAAEQEQQKAMRQLTDMGLAERKLTPQGEKYAASQLKSIEEGAPIQAEMPQIPEKYKTYQINKEKISKYPGLKIPLAGGVEYNVPQPDIYSQMFAYQNASGQNKEDIIYRDVFGKEIPQSEAEADIAQGNTDYFISRKETTRSGIKEVPISKPADLDKAQAKKIKSDFIIDQAKENLATIQEVKKGINYFGAYGMIPAIPSVQPEKYNWQVNIERLLAGKMIDLMTQMKEASKTGATGFGQLSEKEGQILREASTSLKKGLNPEDAMRYLDQMENALNKIIQSKTSKVNISLSDKEAYQEYLRVTGGQ